MTTLDMLLAAIIADPDDDLVRLAYADALEERGLPGDDARCDLIHVQLAIADAERECRCRRCKPGGQHTNGPCAVRMVTVFDGTRSESATVHERELLEWQRAACPLPGLTTWIRGFVHQIDCTTAQWKKHGKRLVREHPIRVVRLTDKTPWQLNGDGNVWVHPDHLRGEYGGYALPKWLWTALLRNGLIQPTKRTVEQCLAILSDSALWWARQPARRESSRSRPRSAAGTAAAGTSPGSSR